jgi:hypothetical protein
MATKIKKPVIKKYSLTAIDHFTRYVLGDTASFNWLLNNGYKEFFATLDAIRDEKKAFQYLLDNKHIILAAFVNAIWDDEKAFAFLMKAKAYEWAAAANIVNGDEKAEAFLKKIKKENYVLLAHAIQSRIHQDGDYNVSPVGALRNLFNFRKAFKKE